MQPCKILIADDERLARQAVILALPGSGYAYTICEATDGADAAVKIRGELPNIIFIDIQMPLLSGMEALQSLPADYAPYIIIVSAHEQFALDAFELGVADYLVKPFSQARFNKAFERAWRHYQAGTELPAIRSLSERLQQLMPQAQSYKSRLSIKDGGRIAIVPCDEVLYLEADKDYVAVHTTARRYLHNETLQALEASLDPAAFVRIHRSAIVNLCFIKELASHHNGDYTVLLKNGAELKLSRSYRDRLLQLIG